MKKRLSHDREDDFTVLTLRETEILKLLSQRQPALSCRATVAIKEKSVKHNISVPLR
jgi:hypothetical protein